MKARGFMSLSLREQYAVSTQMFSQRKVIVLEHASLTGRHIVYAVLLFVFLARSQRLQGTILCIFMHREITASAETSLVGFTYVST